ncbi:MAG: hypothetical protein LUG18_15265 [Candidatus Azobacteroides sp.]|nr:hypothetical protein [Candidatus Azobacteroides sp.]
MGRSIISCADTSGQAQSSLSVDFRDGEYYFLVGEKMSITRVITANITLIQYKGETEADTAWKNIPLGQDIDLSLEEYIGQQVIFRAETTGTYCSAYFRIAKHF